MCSQSRGVWWCVVLQSNKVLKCPGQVSTSSLLLMLRGGTLNVELSWNVQYTYERGPNLWNCWKQCAPLSNLLLPRLQWSLTHATSCIQSNNDLLTYMIIVWITQPCIFAAFLQYILPSCLSGDCCVSTFIRDYVNIFGSRNGGFKSVDHSRLFESVFKDLHSVFVPSEFGQIGIQ